LKKKSKNQIFCVYYTVCEIFSRVFEGRSLFDENANKKNACGQGKDLFLCLSAKLGAIIFAVHKNDAMPHASRLNRDAEVR
jgi:hypothetical protein